MADWEGGKGPILTPKQAFWYFVGALVVVGVLLLIGFISKHGG